MAEQWISLKNLDNINVSSVGKTDHGSILIQESEVPLYANRTDIKILIQNLIDDEKLSNNHSERIEEFSKSFTRNVDYTK